MKTVAENKRENAPQGPVKSGVQPVLQNGSYVKETLFSKLLALPDKIVILTQFAPNMIMALPKNHTCC